MVPLLQVPALGWRCSAEDAAAAVAVGMKLLDAAGEKAAEEALRAAAPETGVLLATALPSPCVLEVYSRVGCQAEQASMGSPSHVVLFQHMCLHCTRTT